MFATDFLALLLRKRFGGQTATEPVPFQTFEETARLADAEAARAVGLLQRAQQFAQGLLEEFAARFRQCFDRLADPGGGPALVKQALSQVRQFEMDHAAVLAVRPLGDQASPLQHEQGLGNGALGGA